MRRGHRSFPNNAVSVRMSEHRDLGWHALGPGGPVHSLPTIIGGSELGTDGFPEIHRRVEVRFLVSSAAAQLTPVLLSYLPNFRPGAVVISSSRHSISSCSSKLFSPSSPSGLSPSTPWPFGSLVPPLLSQSVSFSGRSLSCLTTI